MLRTAPQDIPASSSLLITTLLAYFVVGFLLALVKLEFVQSLGAGLVDVIFLLFISYVMMWVRLTTNRWHQTATSMAAVSTLIGIMAFPVIAMQGMLGTEGALASFSVLILIGLMIWNLVIIAHIFKHSLDASMFVATLLAGFYMYLSLKIMSVLFFQAE